MVDPSLFNGEEGLNNGNGARAIGKRLSYRPPVLTYFGSVRQLTTGTGGNGDDGTLPMNKMSDPSLKENIARIGVHPAGFGIYLFDYKSEFRDAFGHGRQFGVMADEIEQFMPEAVSIDVDGYRRVNYAMIGVTRH